MWWQNDDGILETRGGREEEGRGNNLLTLWQWEGTWYWAMPRLRETRVHIRTTLIHDRKLHRKHFAIHRRNRSYRQGRNHYQPLSMYSRCYLHRPRYSRCSHDRSENKKIRHGKLKIFLFSDCFILKFNILKNTRLELKCSLKIELLQYFYCSDDFLEKKYFFSQKDQFYFAVNIQKLNNIFHILLDEKYRGWCPALGHPLPWAITFLFKWEKNEYFSPYAYCFIFKSALLSKFF